MKTMSLWLLAGAVIAMVGCSAAGPVVIRDVNPPPPVVADDENAPTVAITTPVAPTQAQTASPLIEKLVQQGDTAIAQQAYLQAIQLAERGLRIDRKEPRFYRILSESYRQLGNQQQSLGFARQGLQYAQKASSVYQQLSDLVAQN